MTRLLDDLGAESILRSTDEILARTLPLLEQVLELHERGKVAPLEGIDDLMIEAGAIWFERAKARAPRVAEDELRRLERKESLAFDVAGRYKRVVDDDGTETTFLGVAEPGEKIDRPVYLTRYVAWEHEVGHHDPLTDIFVLGLVLASVALDRSLGDAEGLELFVRHRSNLLALNRRLHPVVARAIVRMTELDRHARVQDLRALVATLRSYREQSIGAFEVAEEKGEAAAPARRRNDVYGKLRDRLFDFSRRNRLLYFSPSGQTVNLTLGSVPLVLDVKSVSPDALFTWGGRAAADVASQKPLPLGRYLRFEDYPFLSPALDQLRLDANRTKTELGYSPLRLVVCFLHWHDLKEAPDARITSPLVLLPVALERKKGVRDAVLLTAETDQAQVNPVLRQYLQQRYGVRLPETIDLADPRAIELLQEELSSQVHASEPGVTIARVDKPKIDLVLAQARRRLEAYKKRVALSGRAARSHRGFDYSYARSKLHPLGVQIFTHLVSPSPAPNRELHEEPRPRVFQHSADVVEKSLYSIHQGGTGGGPYEWAIDLANVTLASFQTRKMSLVRDYAGLLESKEAHASYDTLFSPDARPVAPAEAPVPIEERFDVMPSDPTQASAVARARAGASFIIQGPPGTGKSQTITNLVADYVARGKRVLFVCEKRAAIDVVHHRLRMQGLAPLTCLIHDSQTDKKAFIKDLKETYEAWIAGAPGTEKDDARRKAAEGYGAVLGRASRFRAAMHAPPAGADAPLLSVIGRAIELDDVAAAELPREALPTLRELHGGAAAARAVEQALRALGRDPVFGRHPLRVLADDALFAGDPEALVREAARALAAALDEVLASPIARIGTIAKLGDVVARLRFVERVRPLLEAKAVRLLDEAGDAIRAFERIMVELRERADALAKAASAAAGWTRPLPEEEVSSALAHAKRFEASFLSRLFAWLSPTWWRLRRALAGSFDFASRAVPPAWTEILERLRAKYAAEAAVRELRARGERELGVGELEATAALLEGVREAKGGEPEKELRAWLVARGADAETAALARLGERRARLGEAMARLVRDPERVEPRRLREELAALEGKLGDLPALLEPLRRLAAPEHRALAALVRDHEVTVEQIERAAHRATADAALRERALDVLGGGDWDGLHEDARARAAALRRANAEAIVERARGRFLENVRISGAPNDTLGAEQKKHKKAYAAGRKELEHEFAKTTRYRSIRDLATGAAGVVVRDLKPVWLMSPLSVADTLPLEPTFDVVIFDEASQIPLEDAVPAAHRAAQTIVVGDEMQLPPTDFFGTARRGAGGEDEGDERSEEGGYELDAHSLLTHAAKNLPSTMLGWHYRSRDEALIAFSNRVFYDGKLLTVPSVARAAKRRPIVVASPDDGDAEALLERPISHHRLASSPYEARRNAGEARYIASMLRALLARNHGLTFGVVAFSEAQQGEIEAAIRELGDEDPEFRARYEAELEREEDGQHVGLFVKNLENVQGDERDVIVISVCYGPDANGRMLMNFGPINKMGGEKRLNVIFSRAKHHLAVVSSIPWTAITNEYNDGARCLRTYLRYAEAMSTGAVAEADVALQAYARGGATSAAGASRGVEERLATELRARGYEVDAGIGASQFRCNLGVRRPGDERYRLGILVDDAAHHARAVDEVVDVQPSVLRAFGWTMMTVLQRDWYADRALVMERIETALGVTPA